MALFTGNCPDNLMNYQLDDLNPAQIANLEQAWPAAFDAVNHLHAMVQSGQLYSADGDVLVAPLWVIVRWYLDQVA